MCPMFWVTFAQIHPLSSRTIPTKTFFIHKFSWWRLQGHIINHEYRVVIALSSVVLQVPLIFFWFTFLIYLICSFLYLLLRQGLSVYCWLLWKFLCRPGCALPQRPSCLCSPVLGLKFSPPLPGWSVSLKHHCWASAEAILVRLIMDKENNFDIISTAPCKKKIY